MREALTIIAAALCGLVFGLGLVLSHMVDPAVVASFLDIAGNWNPTLAFVMAGGIAVAAPAFWLARRSKRTLLGETIDLPDRMTITRALIIGAAAFGLGWGLAGICPGPGLTLLGTLDPGALIFVPAVIAGMLLARWRPLQMAVAKPAA